jgi:hypothetical protein
MTVLVDRAHSYPRSMRREPSALRRPRQRSLASLPRRIQRDRRLQARRPPPIAGDGPSRTSFPHGCAMLTVWAYGVVRRRNPSAPSVLYATHLLYGLRGKLRGPRRCALGSRRLQRDAHHRRRRACRRVKLPGGGISGHATPISSSPRRNASRSSRLHGERTRAALASASDPAESITGADFASAASVSSTFSAFSRCGDSCLSWSLG